MKYRCYYGKKYGWIGPLFENTYMAKEIRSLRYFNKVLDYILRNPDVSGREGWQQKNMSKLCAKEVWWNVNRKEVEKSFEDHHDDELLGQEG